MRTVFCLIILFLFSLRAYCKEGEPKAGEDLPKVEEGGEKSVEQYLQSLSTVQGLMTRHDPFAERAPPFDVAPAISAPVEDPFAPVPGAPEMERFAVTDYEVVAVLLGDKYPRALLRLPEEKGVGRKVVIVKESDKLGSRKGLIKKISIDGLTVEQPQRTLHGFIEKIEVQLKVGGKTDEQRRAFFANRSSDEGGKKK